jgi:hypothetical protein
MASAAAIAQKIQIRAVAFKEGDAWVIQGIDYDIVAHTYDLAKIPHAFTRAVIENILITEHLGREALQAIKPGPTRFREMYEKSDTEMRPVHFEIWQEVTIKPEVTVRLAA